MLAYVWDHIIAIVALGTTLAHLIARSRATRKDVMLSLSSAEKLIPTILSGIQQASSFEAGLPITIAIPAESVTLDLTKENQGHVEIRFSGGTFTLQKAP